MICFGLSVFFFSSGITLHSPNPPCFTLINVPTNENAHMVILARRRRNELLEARHLRWKYQINIFIRGSIMMERLQTKDLNFLRYRAYSMATSAALRGLEASWPLYKILLY
ncbi:uncharacterized protein F4822DRAFT_357537 [Hypoxylon trugodes]|uniref:uncharacterized protein n=1 Tax=Hypoxylon trugodes TaxID=326681 RepID=UPI002199A658|nr:uncharacterized protein F4822DRAFT_357537 [Hypoxylon trugodes]KAI1385909.1 hypothetical protein F4822DRAFT_357537 [Hypoxylon trugodes]